MSKKSKLKIIILMVFIINIGYIFVNQELTMLRIKNDIKTKQETVDKLSSENRKLQDQIKLTKTDKYTEKLARERLGLIKEGETPVMDSSEKNK
ncbi:MULTISPECIES: FtsB family cell division protein [Clostridium]|uniref:FtsB family cell division protein n=1 Tax=Clostridium TaxID=1485 RepID=UPI00069DBDF5|nr:MULTISPECIES: septum formation initiator family protein [Clostridium]KOF56203.1 dihydroorotate dehydrogenase [Clostridium sp. DMHC 10]MCD2347877.1 septum formation initiator family protein [Clostridium guangxiense]